MDGGGQGAWGLSSAILESWIDWGQPRGPGGRAGLEGGRWRLLNRSEMGLLRVWCGESLSTGKGLGVRRSAFGRPALGGCSLDEERSLGCLGCLGAGIPRLSPWLASGW
jgi:hypothetical protein